MCQKKNMSDKFLSGNEEKCKRKEMKINKEREQEANRERR